MPKEMAVIEIAWEFYELILRDVVERIDFLIRIVVGGSPSDSNLHELQDINRDGVLPFEFIPWNDLRIIADIFVGAVGAFGIEVKFVLDFLISHLCYHAESRNVIIV